MIKIKKEQFEKLCRDYGLYTEIFEENSTIFASRIDADYWEHWVHYFVEEKESESKSISIDGLEIAELIDFFRSCIGGDMKLEACVTNPRNGEIVSQQKRCVIKSVELQKALEHCLNEIVRKYFGVIYDYALGEEKGFGQVEYALEENDEFRIADAYYSDDEIRKIIEYEREEKNYSARMKDEELEDSLRTYYYRLKRFGIFGTGSLTRKKEFCFLYDFFYLAGKAPYKEYGVCTGDCGRLKVDWVEYHLEKAIGKKR